MRVWGCTDVVVVEMKSFFKNMCVMLLSMISLKCMITMLYLMIQNSQYLGFFLRKKELQHILGLKVEDS